MTVKGNNIILSKKELTDMLQNAAEIALRQAGVTISEEESITETSGNNITDKKITIGSFTEEEYADALHTMELNRGNRKK